MTDVVLLTIDSLRSDHFDSEHFPNCWDTFRSDFALFENCYANGVATPLSFPSILMGHPVEGDGTLPANNPTVSELFDGNTWGLSNNPHLRPERGYDRGFDVFSDTIHMDTSSGLLDDIKDWASQFSTLRKVHSRVQSWQSDSETPPDDIAGNVVSVLGEAIEDRDGLFWAHFEDPHFPFKPQKVPDRNTSISQSYESIQSMNNRFTDGEATEKDLQFLQYWYSEQIRYLDRRLADFFSRLKSFNRWEDALIVLLSDHGEGFGEEGVFSHQWDADPIVPLVRVPLAVKYPGNAHAGYRYDHLVQNADLLATLATELEWDVSVPSGTYPFSNSTTRRVVSKSNTAVRVTTETGSIIKRIDGSQEQSGTIDDRSLDLAQSASYPDVANLSGDVPGMDPSDRKDLNARLEYLGYK